MPYKGSTRLAQDQPSYRPAGLRFAQLLSCLLFLLLLLLPGQARCAADGGQSTSAELPGSDDSTAECVVGCGIPDCRGCGGFLLGRGCWVAAEVLLEGADRPKQRVFCSPACMLRQIKASAGVMQLVSFRVLDHTTLGGAHEQLIAGESAWYLLSTSADSPGADGDPAMDALKITAFSDEQSAVLASGADDELLAGWEDLRAALLKREAAAAAAKSD